MTSPRYARRDWVRQTQETSSAPALASFGGFFLFGSVTIISMYRSWAFWRRVQYGTGLSVVIIALLVFVYFSVFYNAPSCFDGHHNGDERGVDCGGSCAKVCAFDTRAPNVQWARSFRITDGFYNAVAYVENQNLTFGTPELSYTFSLYDRDGELITSRSGTTFLPPDSVYPIFEARIATGNRIPTRTFLEIESIDNWQVATAGREQFTVLDRSLSGVDSKPRLDTTLRNTLIQDEFDVEVVATIFDSEGNALTASRSIVPLFEAREERNVIFTWPEPIAKTIRSCEVPTDVILAIDLSGSMNDDSDNPPEPITSVLDAASSFVDRLNERDQAGVVTFATHARLAQVLLGNRDAVQNIVEALRIDPREEVGSTNMGDAIALAEDEFISPRHNRNARKVLVFLTDGLANAPQDIGEEYALNQAAKAKAADIIIYTIGLGESVNQPFLSTMASSGEHSFFAADTTVLSAIYRTISSSICEDGPAVIDVVPKTPGSLK